MEVKQNNNFFCFVLVFFEEFVNVVNVSVMLGVASCLFGLWGFFFMAGFLLLAFIGSWLK